MPSTEASESNQVFAWDGPTWKASRAVFLTIFAGSGPSLAAQAALDPVLTWVVLVVVVAITDGMGLAAWAIGDVLEESSLVTLVLVGGAVLLLAGRLWAGGEVDALRPGDGIVRAWAAMSVFAAGLAITVGWFIAVLRTPGLRRRAVAVLVTGAAVVSGVAAALAVVGAW